MTTDHGEGGHGGGGHDGGHGGAEQSGGGHGGGTKAIIAALGANLGIATAKFIAFLVTGASSMLAEAIHSVADSGNQVLLLVGGRTSRRRATPEHPFGFGRDRYVYGFLVAMVLFSVGGCFALYEGIHKISAHEELTSPIWAIGVLVVAIGLESFSLRTAVKETNAVRKPGESYWQFIRHARAPELPVVLLEDAAALTGLFFALLGVGLATLTGNPVFDAIGTILIGLLLIAVAAVLGVETKSLLLGEAATPDHQRAIVQALEADGGVRSVIHMRTQHLGPEEILVAAKIEVEHDDTAAGIAAAIDAAEQRVRAAVPAARVIYLEPDLRRAETTHGSSARRG
ncbi:cation diffusion facilitator family transporter [Modestobacter sp. I12A-02628]|uniref:Cation diffusion facilitator family transporter n=1 Tax=Goekera deserti TaxID=2497753 RepID=A0A7K3W7X6_9ACTN|nr:cation diffusion facilitator family transporter [Goekera deserti]MPQ99800.1 cation diffusion facilitator family transporter [Goekera deserti]NDI49957.1 cation diffusion facilitator family transporter [Goekera deserti]NEL52565.1 cation diffusion facilitator family transporter [Goekera deserti]